jgi:tRNA nucleotidyltransferase (CCA-adding enzyme)
MEIYLVGGAVRDALLGLPVRERDWVVVGATPGEMLAQGFTQVGKDFPVFLHPQSHEEYALARTERKTAPGYTGFSVHAAPDVTLEQDLLRRDLTINAMAQTPDGKLIDPFGGQQDLREGLLRHVSPAFAEDPVRILRLARFAARFAKWGFRTAHGTHKLMKQMVAAGEVDALVPERVWKELERALGEDQPARFFEVLSACGALARLFPELARAFPQAGGGHARAGIPALRALTEAAAATPDAAIRLAAFLLSGVKEPTDLRRLAERSRLPKEYRELAELARRHTENWPRIPRLPPAELLDLLEQMDAFRRPQRLARLALVYEALARATDRPLQPEILERLEQARQAAASVDTGTFAARGLKGEEIRQALREARREAIASMEAFR